MNRRDKTVIDLSGKATEFIDGELLGDGTLRGFKETAAFTYSSKYKEYINYISETLKSFGIKRAGKILKHHNKEWDKYVYKYHSIRYAELLPLQKKWYPNGKKVVPPGIKLTPLTVRQWYIGDGQLEIREKHNPRIKLMTDCFSPDDVNMLRKKLERLNIRSIHMVPRNRIYIPPSCVNDFIGYIGNCPVECYQYKWLDIKQLPVFKIEDAPEPQPKTS